jgi:SAM-dependent methyltransferase
MSDTKQPDEVIDRSDPERVVDRVRERYGSIARAGEGGCCPTTSCCGTGEQSVALNLGYTPAELALLPDGANLGLGCGAPVEHMDLRPGERVLDLGSGAGIDALLAASRVGADGLVIGVDMTPEMLGRARQNAAAAGVTNVEFREGRLEQLPVDDASIDAVTSNCVINLVPDKAAVFREIRRVLRPGGRVVVSDIVLDGELPASVSDDILAYVGCVAGAMGRDAYFQMIAAAGLSGVEILRDVDFLGSAEVPPDVRQLADQRKLNLDDLGGIVRSVTYRARRH